MTEEDKQKVGQVLVEVETLIKQYICPKALVLLNSIKDFVQEPDCPENMLIGYYFNRHIAEEKVGDAKAAQTTLLTAYASTPIQNNLNVKACVACKLGEYALSLPPHDKAQALQYFEESIQAADQSGHPLARPYQMKGRLFASESKLEDAIEDLNRAAKIAEEGDALAELALIIMDISDVFWAKGMPETALSEISRAERYMKESHNLDIYNRLCVKQAARLFEMGKDEQGKQLIIDLSKQKN